MTDFTLLALAVLAGIAIGIPFLLAFRSKGRSQCWRCHVWMLPVRTRRRRYALLPIGNCEGCNVPCIALGPRITKIKT